MPAMHGGDSCMGDLVEVKECNTHACPGTSQVTTTVGHISSSHHT